MTGKTSRHRVLVGFGTSFVVGSAGCLSDRGETTADDGDSGDNDGTTTEPAATTRLGEHETTNEQSESMTAKPTDSVATDGSKPLKLGLIGNDKYDSEMVMVELLTFVAASADAESPTIEASETADISEAEYQDPVMVADDLGVPYGTYEPVEMTVTPTKVIDQDGSSVTVSGGTVSRTFMELDEEPNTVEESRFDAALTLYLLIKDGQFKVTGYKSTALG